MDCQVWTEQFDTYLDGELPSSEMAAFDTHVRNCPSCAANVLGRVQLRRAVRSSGMRFQPSPEFRARIQKQIAGRPATVLPRFRWVWAATVAGIVMAAVLSGWFAVQHSRQQVLYSELRDMHVATLASANPVDVISTDRHTVKPWFQGRIPFSFNLPELANTEFTLAGGKVSYLKGTPGAQLVYEYGKHHISVFIYPERTLQLPLQSDGLQTDMAFHTMTWTEGNLRFFVVGDVSADQVRSLGTLLQAANRS
jgi:anti-sigma factor RsiW